MELTKIHWPESVWFFDIDDTLSDTSDVSSSATEGIRKVFSVHFDEQVGLMMKNQVNEYYDLMLQGCRVKKENDWLKIKGGREAFESLFKEVSSRQESIKKIYGVPKKWSRELFVKLAADKFNIRVTPELINEAVDAYWIELSKITQSFADAVELIKTIKSHKRPICLMTSSDARLKMQPDGQFIYNPEYSEALKRERIELLRDKGIDFDLLSIGDPEDKPHKDFFEKGVNKLSGELGFAIDISKAIIVGDQYSMDLQTPKEQLGFGLAILVNRKTPHLEIIDEHQVNTDNLSLIADFLLD